MGIILFIIIIACLFSGPRYYYRRPVMWMRPRMHMGPRMYRGPRMYMGPRMHMPRGPMGGHRF